jgi:hypothetical protein
MDTFDNTQTDLLNYEGRDSNFLTPQEMVSEITRTISSEIIEIDTNSLGMIEYERNDNPQEINPQDLITYYTKSIELKPNTEKHRQYKIPYYGFLNFDVDINKENPTPNDVISTLILTMAVLNTKFPVSKGRALDTLERPFAEYSRDELLEKLAPQDDTNEKSEEITLKNLLIDTYPTLQEDIEEIEDQLEYVLQNPQAFKKSFEEIIVKKDKETGKNLKKCFQYLLRATPSTIALLTLLATSITSCSKIEASAATSEPVPYSYPTSSLISEQGEIASESMIKVEQLPSEVCMLPEDIQYGRDFNIGVEESVQTDDVKEDVEFDNEIIDIENWRNYTVETRESLETGYTIETTTNSSIYLLPLNKDLFLNQEDDILEVEIPSGQNFEITETITLQGDSDEQITFGMLANTFGSKVTALIILNATDSKEAHKEFISHGENAENTVTYIALPENIYPNKIQNVIRSMAYISQYQELNGPFEKDKEYSYLEIIGLNNQQLRREYVQGFTSTGAIVRAGGVCAGATAFSSLIHQYSGDNVEIVEQWAHPVRYFQGAYSPSEYLVDATVDQGREDTYDFRWIQQDNLYIETDITLIPVNKPSSDPLAKPSDDILLLSISFTKDLPENQSSRLLDTLDNYISYREKFLNVSNSAVFLPQVFTHKPTEQTHNTFNMLYNPEDFSIFESEISQNSVLQDVLNLQEAVNSYSPNPETSLSEYLKNTDWYENAIQTKDKDAVDTALRIISYVKIKDQPLQCVGYVSMLSLIYPELNIQYVGGAPVKNAKELVPREILGSSAYDTRSMATGFGGLAYSGKSTTIDFYEIGDQFVITNGVVGHIGAVIGKMIDENGQTVLLVTDSNRLSDGKIRTFTVTKRNADEILGAIPRYLIRSIP